MWPSVGPIRSGAPPLSVGQRLGFAVVLVYLFLIYSRVLDMWLWQLHGPFVAGTLAVIAAFWSGGIRRAARHPIGICLLALTLCIAAAVPLSVWKGGSFGVFREWLKTVLTYGVIAGLVLTARQCRRVFAVIAISICILALLSYFFGVTRADRLGLWQGKYGNPNDLAMVLLTGLPFCWYFAIDRRTSMFRRVLAVGSILVVLSVVVQTGSRAGMLGLAAMLVALFVRSSASRKIPIAAAAFALVLISSVLLPTTVFKRYLTFGKADVTEVATEEERRAQQFAVSSFAARRQLLIDSIRLTLAHPVFGVGPGQFAVAQDTLAQSEGQERGSWQVTHNSFTQISSENGLPALVCYVAALICAFRSVSRRRFPAGAKDTPELADLSSMMSCLRLALIAYCAFSTFASVAYDMHFAVLGGLAVGLSGIGVQLTGARNAAAVRSTHTAQPRTRVEPKAFVVPR